jgi:hypothetical protein
MVRGGLADYGRIEGLEAEWREQLAIDRRRVGGRRRRARPFNGPAPATLILLRRLLPGRT